MQVGSLFLALVSVPLVTQRFGIEGLGVWLLVQQVASHIQLLELGVASTLGRFLSRAQSLGDSVGYGRYASTALVMLILMGAVLILLAFPLGLAFPLIFELPAHIEKDAVWMLVIAMLSTALLLPLRSAFGILSSQHKFVLIASGDGVALILRFTLIILVCNILEQHALVALSMAVFVPGLLTSSALFVIAMRSISQGLLSPRLVSIQSMREFFGISLATMVVTLAATLLRQGSPILAGYSLDVESIPQLALPLMLVTSLGPFIGVANQGLVPIASHLDATRRVEELRIAYLTTVKYTLALGLFLLACMLLFAKYFLLFWLSSKDFDPNYIHLIYINLLIIYAGYCLTIPAMFARTVLVAVGLHRVAARGEFVSVILGLSIGWLLMNVFSLGSTGMALGIAVAYLFRSVGILMRQLALYFDEPPARFYGYVWRDQLLTVVPLFLAFIPALFMKRELRAEIFFSLMAVGLWAHLVFRLIMTELHREKLKYLLNKATFRRFNSKRK